MLDAVPEALARALRTWPLLRRAGKSLRLDHADFRANLALDVVRRVSKWHYGGGRACEAKLALGIQGETSKVVAATNPKMKHPT